MKKCCWLYAKDKLAVYSACFIGKTVADLIDDFNQEVRLKEVTQDKIYYREALLLALEEKGVDISAVSDGEEISFKHRVRFNEKNRSLVLDR